MEFSAMSIIELGFWRPVIFAFYPRWCHPHTSTAW